MTGTVKASTALLLLLGAPAIAQQISTGGFTAKWTNLGNNQMLIQCSGATAGLNGPWVGFSMDPKGDSHSASDMYVGYQSSAGVGVLDTFSLDTDKPDYDRQQDAQNPQVNVINGNLNFSFVRNFVTGDTADQPITNSPTTIGWAFGKGADGMGQGTNYKNHGGKNRGNVRNVNLIGTALPPPGGLPPTPAPTTWTPAIKPPQINVAGFTAMWTIVAANQMLIQCSGATAFTNKPWVAFSMDPNGASHYASDMYVGYQSSAGAGVLDTFSLDTDQPDYDRQQDAQNPQVSVINGNLNFSFIRNFNTGDVSDQPITNSPITVGWAFGNGATGTGSGCYYNNHGFQHRGNVPGTNLIGTAYTK